MVSWFLVSEYTLIDLHPINVATPLFRNKSFYKPLEATNRSMY